MLYMIYKMKYKMKSLKMPSPKDSKSIKECVEFNEYEKKYFDEMEKKRDSELDEKDFRGHIEFYLKELKAIEGKIGKRVAVERRLKYSIGYAYEWLGTHGLEGHEPKERAEMFENAVLWYHLADETVGFYTDYCLRQSESCGGAAHFRREAGINDEKTRAFGERHVYLMTNYLEAMFGKNVEITIKKSDKKDSEHLKQMADKKIESSVDAYLFKEPSEEEVN